MDENRNDELQPDVETEALNGDDGLEKELEDLRDMFQRELDAAESGDEETGELIQSLEDIIEESTSEEPSEEAPKCDCCGVNACSKDHGEDYPYCDSCRELMKRYPLRFSGVLTIFVMVGIFLASVASFVLDPMVASGETPTVDGVFQNALSYIENMEIVAESQALMDEGRVMSAMQGYYGYVSSTNPELVSRKAVNDLLEGFLKTGYFNDASSLINSIYTEEDLEKPYNKKYADIAKRAQVLTDTYYAVTDAAEPALTGQDFDTEELLAKLDALKEVNPLEEGSSEVAEKYDTVFIEYYKFVVMSVANESLEKQLEQLKIVEESDTEDMAWMYLSNYCAIAAKAGDEALAKELFEKAIAINKEDSNAYLGLASYYRYAETPDPDKIIEICNQAKEYSYSGDTSYQQYLAIGYLLKDADPEKGEDDNYGQMALEEMNSYMSSNSYSVQTCNLYALCALYNGDTEIYEEMKSTLETAGYEISDAVEKYKDGKITVKEALQDKEGKI